jgi:exosome complex RNA-binding protein Rrp42 (RNase PH superfamily)
MKNYSENQKDFFKKLLLDLELRTDGRQRLINREYSIDNDVVPSCLSSIRLTCGNKQILFAIKGDIVNSLQEKMIFVSIDSMYKIEDIKLKKEIECYLNDLIISKIPTDILKIGNEGEYYYKLYIDIIIFDTLKLSLLQLLSNGIKHALESINLPSVVLHKNEVTGNIEFDIREAYEDISNAEKVYTPAIRIPTLHVFAVINNNIYLDPTEEEYSVSDSIIIVSNLESKIISVQSVGSNLDINKYFEINNLIKAT